MVVRVGRNGKEEYEYACDDGGYGHGSPSAHVFEVDRVIGERRSRDTNDRGDCVVL